MRQGMVNIIVVPMTLVVGCIIGRRCMRFLEKLN